MSRRQHIINYIISKYSNGREFHSTCIAEELRLSQEHVSAVMTELRQSGNIIKIREEAGSGGKRLRFVYIVAGTENTSFASRVMQVIGAKTLQDYTDEEILQELKRRVA